MSTTNETSGAGPGAVNAGSAYSVELLYPQSPPLNASRLAAPVKNFCPQSDAADTGGRPPILISHKDHLVPVSIDATTDAAVPARTVVMPTDAVTNVGTLHESLSQTRDWDEAIEALARSNSRVVVSDLLAHDLPARERLALFEAVLLGVIEAARPVAIHWKPAGKLVDPAALLRASGSRSLDALPQAALNVRMFRIARTEGDLLMDTLGLASLGLPDLQVLFHGMEPGRVASHLYALVLHALRHGGLVDGDEPVEGTRFEGPTRNTTWTARRSASLVEPPRAVVDFHPGPDYAVQAA